MGHQVAQDLVRFAVRRVAYGCQGSVLVLVYAVRHAPFSGIVHILVDAEGASVVLSDGPLLARVAKCHALCLSSQEGRGEEDHGRNEEPKRHGDESLHVWATSGGRADLSVRLWVGC